MKLSLIQWTQRHSTAIAIVGVTVLYLVVRSSILGRSFAPMWDEERKFGLLPDHLLHGLIVPYWDYLTMPREGGSLLVGPPYAAVFALFGSTFFALRLCNVLFHAVTMIVFCLGAASFAGWRGAVAFGVLWSLAPPGIVHLQQAGFVNHIEACLPMGLALVLLVASLKVAGRRWTGLLALLSGLSAGLAVFFAYSALPMLGSLALIVLVAVRHRSGYPRIAFGVGTLLGLSPAIAVRVHFTNVGEDWLRSGKNVFLFLVHESNESALSLHEPLTARIGALLGRDWHSIFDFAALGWREGAEAVDLVYLVCVGGLAVLTVGLQLGNGPALRRLVRGESRAGEIIVLVTLLSLLSYISAYLSSDFGGGSANRYLAPLFPYLILLSSGSLISNAADGLPAWLEKRKSFPVIVLGCAAVIGGIGAAQFYRNGQESGHFDRVIKGYYFVNAASAFNCISVEEKIRAIRSHPRDRVELLRLLGFQETGAWLEEGMDGATWSMADQRVAALPSCWVPYYWEGVGLSLGEWTLDPEARWRVAETLANRAGRHLDEHALAFGLGNGFVRDRYDRLGEGWPLLEASLPDELRHSMCLGLGAADMRQRNYTTAPIVARGELGDCDIDTYATGLGVQLARELLHPDQIPEETPRVDWWLTDDLAPAAQGPMIDGLLDEAGRMAMVSACNSEERR